MKAYTFAATQPWAILPAMLQTILSVAGRESDPVAVAAKLGHPLENTRTVQVREGVAIIPVVGPLMRYANLLSNVSGATSIEVLATDFNEALHNAEIKAIVLEIDSPGGTVAGVNELSQMIYASRGQKPIIAYVSGMGASAAYWLASACDEIVLEATASVGSIGVVSVYSDESERKAKAGIKEIQIVSSSSPKKHLDPSTEAGRSDIQALVDNIAQVFISNVAKYRQVSIEYVLSSFGQGALLIGSDAVKAGMAQRVGSLESIISQLTHHQPLSRGNFMTQSINSETSTISVEFIAEQYPAIAKAFRQEGATAERARIQAVEAQSIPGQEALIQTFKFDGKTTAEQAAIEVLAAIKKEKHTLLAHLKADAPEVLPMPALAHADKKEVQKEDTRPPHEQDEAQWDNDPAIRAEFGSKEGFMAYRRAKRNGQVAILEPGLNA